MNNFLNTVSNSLPGILVGVILLIVAFIVATIVKNVVVKLLNKTKIKEKLSASGKDPKEAGSIINLIGNIVFLFVFLLFLPASFSRLGLEGITLPFTNFANFFIAFLPKLIAAGIVLYIGFFVAKIVKEVVQQLLVRTGVDGFVARTLKTTENNVKVSEVVASLVCAFIIIPLIIVALDLLGLQVISVPARQILDQLLGYIPKLFVAILILALGFFIAKFVASLLKNILDGFNVNSIFKNNAGVQAFDFSKILSQIVQYVLMVVFFVEAMNVLDLEVLRNIGSAVIAYLPQVISAAIILIGAYFLAQFAERKIVELNPNNRFLGMLVKSLIIVISVFMTLSQLGFARNIVEYAFIIVFAGVAVAFALAFGIGGKAFAKNCLEKLEEKINRK